MNVEQVKSAYRSALGQFETVAIRRYSGIGNTRAYVDYPCLGRATGYAAHELVGSIIEGDTKVWVFVDDLVNAGLALPLSTSRDRVVIEGMEHAVVSVDAATVRLQGQTVAFILQARGGVIAGRQSPIVDSPSLDFSSADNSGYLALLEDI